MVSPDTDRHPFVSCPFLEQGESDATSAEYNAVDVLGFPANVYIYFDMEGFNTTATCDTAAESCINGWEYEMHTVLGAHGGVYGSACSSDIENYTAHSNVPEAIWPLWTSDPSHTSLPLIPLGMTIL